MNGNLSHIAKPDETIWFHSMGKRFRIVAIFTTDADANAFMERHNDAALIAEFGPFRILANKYAGVRDAV